MTDEPEAIRALVSGELGGESFRGAAKLRASELGVLGWVRERDDGTAEVHAEGDPGAVAEMLAFLREGPPGTTVDDVVVERLAKREGHEQFAVRGVDAGGFLVAGHPAPSRAFELRLEVGGVMRSWLLPKGPSMDPAQKRFAIEVETEAGERTVWDRGGYEQGGRVAWPEALERGHAVFVLNGAKLRGGFTLQRTRPRPKPQWLLIKRKDEFAEPGSDVTAER